MVKKKEKEIKKEKKVDIFKDQVIEEISIDKPSLSFCERCKNSDLRSVKEKMNEAIILIKVVAEELGITGEKYINIKKELIEWVIEQRRIKEIKLKNKNKENKKSTTPTLKG